MPVLDISISQIFYVVVRHGFVRDSENIPLKKKKVFLTNLKKQLSNNENNAWFQTC